jgi:hypothetical protein
MREITVFLPQPAVLARIIGALPHEGAGGGIHL